MTIPRSESEAHAQANAQQVRLLREALAQRQPGGRDPAGDARSAAAGSEPQTHAQPRGRP